MHLYNTRLTLLFMLLFFAQNLTAFYWVDIWVYNPVLILMGLLQFFLPLGIPFVQLYREWQGYYCGCYAIFPRGAVRAMIFVIIAVDIPFIMSGFYTAHDYWFPHFITLYFMTVMVELVTLYHLYRYVHWQPWESKS